MKVEKALNSCAVNSSDEWLVIGSNSGGESWRIIESQPTEGKATKAAQVLRASDIRNNNWLWMYRVVAKGAVDVATG